MIASSGLVALAFFFLALVSGSIHAAVAALFVGVIWFFYFMGGFGR